MNSEAKLTAVDFFCGAGGASRGIHDAGFDLIAAVDKNADALQSHNESLPSPVIKHDLSEVDTSVLPDVDIDYFHGSPSCQGFSDAGNRDPEDERNGLVFRTIEWVQELRPKVVTIENVPGMATISSTFMDTVIGEFRRAGYSAKWRILNAADYGVPQTRERLFIVAVRDDLELPTRWFPKPTHERAGCVTLDGRELDQWITARQSIDDIAVPMATDGGVPSLSNHEPQDHRQDTRERFYQMKPGHKDGPTNETRLAGDVPSRTIVSGNGTPPVHYRGERVEEMRRLTVRECARLQSFPDEHVFVGGKEEQYRQVGNAVPPKLQEAVASHVREMVA